MAKDKNILFGFGKIKIVKEVPPSKAENCQNIIFGNKKNDKKSITLRNETFKKGFKK